MVGHGVRYLPLLGHLGMAPGVRSFAPARNHQKTTGLGPFDPPAEYPRRGCHRLGDHQARRTGRKGFDPPDPWLDIGDAELPPHRPLKMVPPFPAIDEHDRERRPCDRDRNPRESCPGTEVDETPFPACTDFAIDGGQQRQGVDNQVPDHAPNRLVTRQVGAAPPIHHHFGEVEEPLLLGILEFDLQGAQRRGQALRGLGSLVIPVFG